MVLAPYEHYGTALDYCTLSTTTTAIAASGGKMSLCCTVPFLIPLPPIYSSPSRSTRKQGGYILYGRSDTHRHFAIYVFNPCFRVLHEGDEYTHCYRSKSPPLAFLPPYYHWSPRPRVSRKNVSRLGVYLNQTNCD